MESVFVRQKRKALNQLAAAERVGDADEELMPLLTKINSHPDYYTTSSCAGRIVLLVDLGSKHESGFLGKWHRRVGAGEVLSALSSESDKGTVWFKYESPIIHVVAQNLDSAEKMARIAYGAGFKRTGIIVAKPGRFVIEVLSTERVEAPVMRDGVQLAGDEYVVHLIEEANKKYDQGVRKIEKLNDGVQTL